MTRLRLGLHEFHYERLSALRDPQALFFAVGLLQAGSFQVAVRIAERIGLINTMVFTHLPSNLLLATVAFAPNLPVAVGLLLGRFALAQRDVPPRQAYGVAGVDPWGGRGGSVAGSQRVRRCMAGAAGGRGRPSA